jgi:predicted NACHT family NTPase
VATSSSVRTLQASTQGIEKAKYQLAELRFTYKLLAEDLKITTQPIIKFFNGRPVKRDYFVKICEALELEWDEIYLKPSVPVMTSQEGTDIDELVQSLRKQVSTQIQTRCGFMRTLGMSKPIDLETIYTDVYIVEQITANRGYSEAVQDLVPEAIDHYGLNPPRKERLPGLEVIQKYGKVMILGKPGAGKSTFLKRLAMLCNAGHFLVDKVPCFIVLSMFAETPGSPRLLQYLSEELQKLTTFERIITEGKLLVLLDGLDEVRKNHRRRVLSEIRDFSERYPKNTFVVSCRIGAESIFEQFTDVEISDFDEKQISHFVENWYIQKDPDRAKAFLEKLRRYPRVRELATNPLLLTLLCLLFDQSDDFASKRSELYEKALDVLLRKWDEKRDIERSRLHKSLTLDRIKDLLSQLAYQSFDRQDHLFEQKWAEREIIYYIQELPDVLPDPEASPLDGQSILKSITVNHGLLVEQATAIYSFSHLTFHEFFVARWIVTANDPKDIEHLVQHVCDPKWREVFLLTADMLRQADRLLLSMRREIGNVVTSQPNLNQFFVWLNRKSSSIASSHKLAAVRALYLSLSLSLDRDRDLLLSREHLLLLSHNLDHNLSLLLPYNLPLDLSLDHELFFLVYLSLERNRDLSHNRNPGSAIKLASQIQVDDRLLSTLSATKVDLQCLPKQGASESDFELWRRSIHERYLQLRQACISHRDLGHDWQFTDEEVQILEQYILANQLLVDCMKSECYLSPEVREELEKNLLVENFDKQP